MAAHVTTPGTVEPKMWMGGIEPMKASYGKLMMWFFLISDTFTFSALLVAYGTDRFSYTEFEGNRADFTFSNMGCITIKEKYGTVEVENVYSPETIFTFGNPTTLFASAFKGQLDFIITSDEHFLKYDDAIAIKKKAMELLKEVTGVAEMQMN